MDAKGSALVSDFPDASRGTFINQNTRARPAAVPGEDLVPDAEPVAREKSHP